MPFRASARIGALGLLPALVACGGGMPLLHPAHSLPAGDLSGTVGASGHFLLGGVDEAIDAADGEGPAVEGDAAQRTAEGVAASVLGEPGVAPFLSARAGVADHLEAGVAYSGRSVRVDGRYALEERHFALSGGPGLELVLAHPSDDPENGRPTSPTLRGVDPSGVSGWAISLPVIVGYRSDAELVQLWGGVRGRYERASGEVLLALEQNPSAELSAHAVSAEVLVGLAVGLPPIWVAAEVSVGYLNVQGDLEPSGGNRSSASVDGVTVSPAGALIARF
jgi:hypothetical protein